MIERIRPILDRPFFYQFYHSLIGANYRSRVLVTEYIRPQAHDRILDIGCGPGNMLLFLPECQYLGVDANPTCVAFARQRYGNRGEFICQRVSHHSVRQLGAFDIVLALGVVHHLDDSEARDLFRLGYTSLKPGGRMITSDGCYTPRQSAAKRYLLSRDRGRFVRTQEQYLDLARARFQEVHAHLREDVLRIPYTHLILECIRGTADADKGDI
ncbi:MAG: class I SAM-dependent methyltransferase [Candidatus Korobacteraceae bacterium]|jgi:cyclopropane fatty-acyl-phospholipid synthase-like methyltransferase